MQLSNVSVEEKYKNAASVIKWRHIPNTTLHQKSLFVDKEWTDASLLNDLDISVLWLLPTHVWSNCDE